MRACPACGDSQWTDAFETRGFQLSRCRACTHLFVSSGLDSDTLASAYSRGYYKANDAEPGTGYRDYLGDSARRISGFEWRLRQIEAHCQERGRLLDFGCAVGLFVKVAADAGWQAVGYERSEWAAEYGRSHLGVQIHVGSMAEVLTDAPPFDVVSMWDVLEHLEDPSESLRWVRSRLRSGGLLALNTVNAGSLGARLAGRRWRHIAPPHHLQYFSRRSLERLLSQQGFEICSAEANGVMLSAANPASSLSALPRLVERACTHWRVRRLATAADLLDEIEILAIRC